eukprot:1648775-Rhodomonas_salina.2
MVVPAHNVSCDQRCDFLVFRRCVRRDCAEARNQVVSRAFIPGAQLNAFDSAAALRRQDEEPERVEGEANEKDFLKKLKAYQVTCIPGRRARYRRRSPVLTGRSVVADCSGHARGLGPGGRCRGGEAQSHGTRPPQGTGTAIADRASRAGTGCVGGMMSKATASKEYKTVREAVLTRGCVRLDFTARVPACIGLRACYAMPGTLAYGATSAPHARQSAVAFRGQEPQKFRGPLPQLAGQGETRYASTL